MANEADVELENPLINYKNKGHDAILEGLDTVEGTICFKVKFIKNSGETETWFFKRDNFELVEKKVISKNAELENNIVDIFYGDYRILQGVNIPFKSETRMNGQNILTVTVKKIELNVPVPDTEFNP